MKSIQKRLYTVLPRPSPSRPRSNSSSTPRSLYTSSTVPLSFFDTAPPPPPSSSRSGPPSPARLPAEPKPTELEGPPTSHGHSTHHHGPFSHLALTSPPTSSSHTLSPYSPAHASLFPYAPHALLPSTAPGPTADEHARPAPKRPRLKYQLDVGAYGIPKRCRLPHVVPSQSPSHTDDLSLAVQVGEDAYFIRSNAMGVADGVGGWSRTKLPASPSSPTPSALFARRLMHFCSAELSSLPPSISSQHPNPTATSSSHPHSIPTPAAPSTWYWSDPPPTFPEYDDYEEALQDSLDELSDGIDVLQILERAYDQTLKAHVVPEPSPPPAPTPLLTGSSTALLAVLDHPPSANSNSILASASSSSTSQSSQTSQLQPQNAPFNYAAGSLNCTLQPLPLHDTSEPYDAVIKIAHIGDCMGMLVRGEDIAWRSEEMWWDFNTPVQLGPSTPTTPLTSAHSFALPVRVDDILILASDGLSDNLWDEDVLDEVVRFRRGFFPTSSASASSSPSTPETAPADLLLRRRTLAGMLSEALCSRARRVSERRSSSSSPRRPSSPSSTRPPTIPEDSDPFASEVPFARRAREVGKVFRGGKNDDISVIVAVISPLSDLPASPSPVPSQPPA